MLPVLFWPYEELNVEKLEGPRAFCFSTPWYSSNITVSSDGEHLLERVFGGESADIHPEELLHGYTQIFKSLSQEPFAYILPTEQAATILPKRTTEIANLNSNQKVTSWTWDTQAILQMSRVEGSGFHFPLTVYSVLRRFFFLDAAETDQTAKLFAFATELSGTAKYKANILANLITQNLHVTERAEQVLKAALPIAADATGVLEEFIADEHGHDELMRSALKAFPVELSTLGTEVNQATIELMNRFEKVAQSNFLAFAFTVSLFERPHASPVHPLTNALRTHGFEEVAKRYDRHHSINVQGGHDNIAVDLISKLPLMTAEEVIHATRQSEYLCQALLNQSSSVLKSLTDANVF